MRFFTAWKNTCTPVPIINNKKIIFLQLILFSRYSISERLKITLFLAVPITLPITIKTIRKYRVPEHDNYVHEPKVVNFGTKTMKINIRIIYVTYTHNHNRSNITNL